MSEPLSNALGINKLTVTREVDYLSVGREQDIYVEGYNRAINYIDQLSPDVHKLAEILPEQLMSGINYHYSDYVNLAQEIINSMNVWIVKKGV